MDKSNNQPDSTLFTQLESLKNAAKDLQKYPIFLTNTALTTIKPLLERETKADSCFSTDPNLRKLCQLLTNLKSHIDKLEKSEGYSLKSLITRQITIFKISQIACAIEAEIQAYTDRESIQSLVRTLAESDNEDDKVKVLIEFENRVSQGFDLDFQELILKAKVFSVLELLLCGSTTCSKKVQEQVALAIVALVRFNKNVFVGLVLMGRTIQALISIGTPCSIKILSFLIEIIRIPLIDELESKREISKIVGFLSSENPSVQLAAMDCVLAIAKFGRQEAIQAMIENGLIDKLMELQRSENRSNLVEADQCNELETEAICNEEMKNFAFSSCVARFAVQVEVGEVLSGKEKKETKMDILRRVREASASEAEAASIVAEVLWGLSS